FDLRFRGAGHRKRDRRTGRGSLPGRRKRGSPAAGTGVWWSGMAVRGEEGARALYRAYGDELYRFALKRLRDPALAEEVVQDVFLRAWRHQDQFDPQRASQRTWLFEIARNLTTDAHR